MKALRAMDDSIIIELNSDEAGVLQAALGVVVDNTTGSPLSRLFDLLDARSVIQSAVVSFEEDPNYDPEEPFGHDTMLVLSDI